MVSWMEEMMSPPKGVILSSNGGTKNGGDFHDLESEKFANRMSLM